MNKAAPDKYTLKRGHPTDEEVRVMCRHSRFGDLLTTCFMLERHKTLMGDGVDYGLPRYVFLWALPQLVKMGVARVIPREEPAPAAVPDEPTGWKDVYVRLYGKESQQPWKNLRRNIKTRISEYVEKYAPGDDAEN